jgi:hypothetical protein
MPPDPRSRARPAARRGRSPRSQRSAARLLRSSLLVVAITWLPAGVGSALGFSLLRSWAVASGYAGLSWALPGFLLGFAATRAARDRRLPLYRVQGVIAGVGSAMLLLVGAARIIGS